VGKLYELISAPGGLWDQVVFETPDGKRLAYTATIKTRLGAIEVELWPDIAPNHVRNFIALARAGYYDGLEFDQTNREEFADEPGNFRKLLVGGSPISTEEPFYNSIGYWMKPEIILTEKGFPVSLHDVGTVGAWYEGYVESAACKFYISLCKDPSMDGSYTAFGKVTQGLDVARKIFEQPSRQDEGLRDRFVQPVLIESVTIASRVAEADGKH
jgi:peptidyl-prolyl cis-trans isomerase B (cyclophilin B)